MSNIFDEIIGKAAQDAVFRNERISNPKAATSGYNLDEEQLKELKLMADSSFDPSGNLLDQRISKARFQGGVW